MFFERFTIQNITTEALRTIRVIATTKPTANGNLLTFSFDTSPRLGSDGGPSPEKRKQRTLCIKKKEKNRFCFRNTVKEVNESTTAYTKGGLRVDYNSAVGGNVNMREQKYSLDILPFTKPLFSTRLFGKYKHKLFEILEIPSGVLTHAELGQIVNNLMNDDRDDDKQLDNEDCKY